jgi:hypothetical protein
MLVTVSVLRELELGIPETLGGYLVAALLQVRILVAPTIIILLLGRAILDLIVCVTAIKTKIVVAAVAQQCIEEGVNLKVWVETRVYFKILS